MAEATERIALVNPGLSRAKVNLVHPPQLIGTLPDKGPPVTSHIVIVTMVIRDCTVV
jgi:hypothetical protein